MKNPLVLLTVFSCIVTASFIASCNGTDSSSTKDNTARPTIPDDRDRNIGDDGTNDNKINKDNTTGSSVMTDSTRITTRPGKRHTKPARF